MFFVQFGSNVAYGPRITWSKFEMATATFYASTETPHIPSRTIILFRFLDRVHLDKWNGTTKIFVRPMGAGLKVYSMQIDLPSIKMRYFDLRVWVS